MRIAVIGAGISGLGAAYILRRSHDVTVFEREPLAGGHARTIDVVDGETTIPIDVGFIVYNERTYPLLTRLFAELDVPTRASDMSFSVACERCKIEFATTSLRALLAKPSNVLKPAFWRTVMGFRRFFRRARAALNDPAMAAMPLDVWRRRAALSDDFERHFLAPMTAAIWSTSARRTGEFPIGELFRFYDNHGLLAFGGRPRWRTVTGGSRTYVRKLLGILGPRVRTATPVAAVRRDDDGVTVTAAGEHLRFDAVVFAVHADMTLRLLQDAAPEERTALAAFEYATNPLVLHRDPTFLPRSAAAAASWNYRVRDCRAPEVGVPITYAMTRLQSLPTRTPWSVTLNAEAPLGDADVAHRTTFEHPLGTPAAAAARAALRALNGRRRTWFAGAHLGFGFHEDGLRSAVDVARGLGIEW